jgi:DNA-binding transcriptional MerR regulator
MKNEELDQRIEKVYFSIGEVAEILSLKPYVLRYWQSEFSQINPRKNNAGIRRYTKADIETILQIKDLLHVRKFTIKGAKAHLKALKDETVSDSRFRFSDEQKKEIKQIQARVDSLLSLLD